MKPTDEDVEVAGQALDAATTKSIGVTLNGIRAALEAYTPRLIERLAKEARHDALSVASRHAHFVEVCTTYRVHAETLGFLAELADQQADILAMLAEMMEKK